VSLRPHDLLPALVPKLLVRPITLPHVISLREVAAVTGECIHLQLRLLVPALVGEIEAESAETHEALQQAATAVMRAVRTKGAQYAVDELLQQLQSDAPGRRRWGAWLCEQFFSNTSAEFTDYVPIFLKELLVLFNDASEPVLLAAGKAFKALNSAVPIEDLVSHLEFVRNCIGSMASDARHRKGASREGPYLLGGLNVPKGLEPLLPIYQHALMHGSPHMREIAASGLGELIELTGAPALKPFLIKLTGPLIRIVGDRFPSGVKAAILTTLSLLLAKGGVALKSFVPQLQTTFVKSLSDPHSHVRRHGGAALRLLMPLSSRVDPLVNELVAGAVGGDDEAIRVTMLGSLADVAVSPAATKLTPGVVEGLAKAMCELLSGEDGAVQEAAACVVNAAMKGEAKEAFQSHIGKKITERAAAMVDK
jgi:hypothetical protein